LGPLPFQFVPFSFWRSADGAFSSFFSVPRRRLPPLDCRAFPFFFRRVTYPVLALRVLGYFSLGFRFLVSWEFLYSPPPCSARPRRRPACALLLHFLLGSVFTCRNRLCISPKTKSLPPPAPPFSSFARTFVSLWTAYIIVTCLINSGLCLPILLVTSSASSPPHG